MRNLSQGNKKNFVIFAVIIVIIIAILIASLFLVSRVSKIKYNIEDKALAYDIEYNPISIDQSAVIDRKWDSNYYLHLKEDGTITKLGKNAVLYYTTKLKLDIYGKSYEIQLNGDVIESVEKNEIINLSENRIFKIADRRYLITGSEIKNQTGSLNTRNYLMIVIDKSGNTLLMNNELNTKTINPMVIQTSSFLFDVANEKLKYDNKEIDLKKIEGSTNEYKEKTKEEANSNMTQNNNSGNNNGNNNYNGNGTIINNNNNSVINNNNNQNNTNISINNPDKDNTNNTELIKSLSLRSVTAASSYIDVEYTVIDPENKYQIVYIILEGNGEQNHIILDKGKTTYRIEGLSPNTQYSVSLAYKVIKGDATTQEYIEDAITIRTEKVLANITIDKITNNKVYFTVKIDQNYIFDSAKVGIYHKGQEKEKIDINIEQATSESGWTSSFEIEDKMGELMLKLESVYYQNKEIDYDISTKIRF